MPLFKLATVKHIEQIGAQTKLFQLQPHEEVSFKAGQFITLNLPIHEKKHKRLRSYSIASSPNNPSCLEIAISLHPQSTGGSSYMFNEVKEGSVLEFSGPQGVFTLPDALSYPLYFICTGTGVAPFRSMLNSILNHPLNHTIHLIFGCRTSLDLIFANEFTQLQQQHSLFHYHPVTSREQNPNMNTGYVHQVYSQLIKEQGTAGTFFLCGWKNMIDDAKQQLTNLGIAKEQIKYELYG